MRVFWWNNLTWQATAFIPLNLGRGYGIVSFFWKSITCQSQAICIMSSTEPLQLLTHRYSYPVAVLCALQSWARAKHGCGRRIHAQPRVRWTYISLLLYAWIAFTRNISSHMHPSHRFEVEDAPVSRMDKRLDIRTCYDFVLKSVRVAVHIICHCLVCQCILFPHKLKTRSSTPLR